MIEIIAISSLGDGESDAELYFANSDEEAELFCEMWNEKEIDFVQNVGGYPGRAFTAALAIPVTKWIRERETELEEVEA